MAFCGQKRFERQQFRLLDSLWKCLRETALALFLQIDTSMRNEAHLSLCDEPYSFEKILTLKHSFYE
jgi:hypothetical protein